MRTSESDGIMPHAYTTIKITHIYGKKGVYKMEKVVTKIAGRTTALAGKNVVGSHGNPVVTSYI